MSRTPWIVICDGRAPGETAYTLRCLRCLDTLAPALPVSVVLWVEIARAFGRAHRGCRE